MSIRKRVWTNKDGSKTVRYLYDYTTNGTRHRVSFDHKPTIRELAELTDTVSNNPYIKEAMNDFISHHCKLHCKDSTIETYQNYVDVALKPLYLQRVKDIKRQHLERFIIGLLEKKSPKTINNLLTFIKSFFNYMVDLKYISENPARKIRALPLKRDKVKAFNEIEQKTFIEKAQNKPFWVYVFFMTILYQGLRISECIALTWADIDFKNKLMNINKQFYRYRVTPTKNYETRIIDIPDVLLDLLKELYKHRQSDLLFDSPLVVGKHINVNNMRERHFKDILTEVEEELDTDLSGFTPHCLRHTHATYLLRNGVPVIAVSRRLGHRDCKTTLNIYNHCMSEDNTRVINLLNNLSNGTKNGTKKTETQSYSGRGVRVV